MRPLLFLAMLAATPLSAQSWQTMTVERASTAQEHLDIMVRQRVGRLQIQASDDSMRYRANLRFDARSLAPLYELSANGELRIGTHEQRDRRDGESRSTQLDLSLGRIGTLALDARADAAETMLDLGGLPLTAVAVSSGASDMRVRFDEPNPVRMQSLTLSTGAASITGERLGNANAAQIVVRADRAGPVRHVAERHGSARRDRAGHPHNPRAVAGGRAGGDVARARVLLPVRLESPQRCVRE
jgi:hypothetical protein